MVKVFGAVVKIGVAAGIIYWMYYKGLLDFEVFSHINTNAGTAALFVAGGLSVFIGLMLLGLRLMLLLRYHRFEVPFISMVGLTLIGSFFGTVLLGLLGGDAVKAVYMCGNVPERRMDALAAIVVDRTIGVFSLLLLGTLALIAAVVAGIPIPFSSPVLMAAPCAVVAMAGGAWLITLDKFKQFPPIRKLYSMVPKKLQNSEWSFRGYLRYPGLIGISILLSVLNHALVVVGFLAAAVILGDEMPSFSHFILDPLAMLMNMIPVTPGGLGMAEGAFAFLFKAAGSLNGAEIGLLGRFIQYVVFVVGGGLSLLTLRLGGRIGISNPEER